MQTVDISESTITKPPFWAGMNQHFYYFFSKCATLSVVLALGLLCPGSILTGLLLLVPALSWAGGGTVNNCTEADLRTAMAGGGIVTFACDGTISLTNTITIDAEVILDGGGHALTISGGNAVRVFYVPPGATLTLIHLTIRAGRTPDGSNGVWTPSGPVPGGPGGVGGGFYNAGTLILRDCLVTANRTGNGGSGYSGSYGSFQYSAGGPGGAGGGIYNTRTLVLSNCIVSDNSTGNGGVSGTSGIPSFLTTKSGDGGFGAGIYNAGVLHLDNSTVTGNSTGNGAYTPTYWEGANGGAGGGIWSGGDLTASSCTFSGNSTGSGGPGGAYNKPGPAATGGTGGAGGGICSTGSLTLTNCTLADNSTGQGGQGGQGTFYGGNGGSGGSGAGIYSQNNLLLLNCTIAINRAGSGGAAGYGSYGSGSFGPVGHGGGVTTGSAQLLNTIIASNTGNPSDVSGAFSSLGHNLIGATDGSSGFPRVGDLVGSSAAPLNPGLAPLANNGGPTFTMPLLTGSLAIDSADPSSYPTTDQRGYPRPNGVTADMGAYEYGSMLPALTITQIGPTNLNILVRGNANQSCRLLTASNFMVWIPIATNNIGLDGTVSFRVNCNPAEACRLYRVSMP